MNTFLQVPVGYGGGFSLQIPTPRENRELASLRTKN